MIHARLPRNRHKTFPDWEAATDWVNRKYPEATFVDDGRQTVVYLNDELDFDEDTTKKIVLWESDT